MPLPVIISRNAVQSPDGQAATIARVTNANTGVYTVPTGKITKIIGATMVIDVLSADATSALAILRSSAFRAIGAFVGLGGASILTNSIVLGAGDIVTNIGDAGATNTTCDMSVTFKEFDV